MKCKGEYIDLDQVRGSLPASLSRQRAEVGPTSRGDAGGVLQQALPFLCTARQALGTKWYSQWFNAGLSMIAKSAR
jgi:hypothetical protein